MDQRCSGRAHLRGGGVGRRLGAGGAGAAASSLSSSSALGLVLSLRVPKPPKKDFAGFSTASGTSASSTTYSCSPQLVLLCSVGTEVVLTLEIQVRRL